MIPAVLVLPAPTGDSRHEHMVRRFSRERIAIERLRRLGAERDAAGELVSVTVARLGVSGPEITFHGRRGPHTGWCLPPRPTAEARFGIDAVGAWESRRGRRWPEQGMIRLGDPTSLGTIAHELGHHLVHVLDPARTPDHGKRWVQRFDQAANAMVALVGA